MIGKEKYMQNIDKKLTCHAERRIDLRVSASPIYEIPEHLTASPTDTGSHNSLRCVGSLCKVRNDMKSKFLVPQCPSILVPLKKAAFTLAEVLITLGIIGVVVAMTLPALIENHQKQVTVTRLKKAYTILAEATKMSEIVNGSINDWDFDLPSETFLKTYVDPFVKYIGKDHGSSVNQRINYKYLNGETVTECMINNSHEGVRQLADGTIFFIDSWSPGDNTFRGILIDINGYKRPNMIGKDAFSFAYIKEKGLVVSDFSQQDRDNLLSNKLHMCNKASSKGGYACSELIVLDGWQIKDDYPW